MFIRLVPAPRTPRRPAVPNFSATAKRSLISYSEIEGLQLAHTLLYSASAQPEGIVLELRVQQGGGNYTSRVVCPDGSFARVMRLMRYLCENGIGPGQWLDVLDDLHQPYRPLAAVEDEPGEENSREFVPFAGFNTENLLHNTELTQSV